MNKYSDSQFAILQELTKGRRSTQRLLEIFSTPELSFNLKKMLTHGYIEKVSIVGFEGYAITDVGHEYIKAVQE